MSCNCWLKVSASHAFLTGEVKKMLGKDKANRGRASAERGPRYAPTADPAAQRSHRDRV